MQHLKNTEMADSMILLADNQWARLCELLAIMQVSKLFVLTDVNTSKHCFPILMERLKDVQQPLVKLKIQAGEEHKNLETASNIWEQMTEAGADRKAVLINLGGGVITDIGGFVASTYKRGIQFIHIPTSLMGMVDASIGGKCGIDFLHYKNHLGVFKQPTSILIDPAFLDTLEAQEIISGAAEMVKHALIGDAVAWQEMKDKEGFEWLNAHAIHRSVEFKLGITQRDPLEQDLRKSLNFGHTIGHAIESFYLSKGKPIRHGLAVAAGILCESILSKKQLQLSNLECTQIEAYILRHYQKLSFSKADISAILDFMKQDKKNREGRLQYVLLKSIGEVVWDIEVKEQDIKEALMHYIDC